MKASILYNPNSDHARQVEEFNRHLQMRSSREMDLVSTETKEGANLSTVYGILKYQAVLITRDDGSLVSLWQNENMPLIDEVIGYLNN